jgi:hypothetical protein
MDYVAMIWIIGISAGCFFLCAVNDMLVRRLCSANEANNRVVNIV